MSPQPEHPDHPETAVAGANMNKLAIISVLATMMLGGCLFPSAPAEESSVLMPLKVGNMWIGDRTRSTPSGNVTVRDTLVITEEQILECCNIIALSIAQFE